MRTLFFISTLLILTVSTGCRRQYGKGVHRKAHKKPASVAIGNVDHSKTKVVLNKFVLLSSERYRRSKVEPICRGLDGCLDICVHFDGKNAKKKCKQMSIKQVVNFWINKISQYPDWKPAQKDLKFIATNKDVALFLQNVDTNHRVLKNLFRLGTTAHCPISLNLGIQHAPFTALYIANTPNQTPAHINYFNTGEEEAKPGQTADSSLVAVQSASSSEGAAGADFDDPFDAPEDASEENAAALSDPVLSVESGGPITPLENENLEQVHNPHSDPAAASAEKENSFRLVWDVKQEKRKIIDSALTSFDFPIFFSFIKKCFGADPRRTFTDVAVEIENRPAFEIAHSVLSEACHHNNECIRLAYCDINSKKVWKQVDTQHKEPGCGYEHFIEPIAPDESHYSSEEEAEEETTPPAEEALPAL